MIMEFCLVYYKKERSDTLIPASRDLRFAPTGICDPKFRIYVIKIQI